jgi:hypothetical protein
MASAVCRHGTPSLQHTPPAHPNHHRLPGLFAGDGSEHISDWCPKNVQPWYLLVCSVPQNPLSKVQLPKKGIQHCWMLREQQGHWA